MSHSSKPTRPAALANWLMIVAFLVVLMVAVSSLVKTLRTLRETVDMLREEAVPMVADLRRAVDHATVGLERVDDLLDTAEDISTTVDVASRLTYRALSPPLIGAASLAAGLGRFLRGLRGGTSGRGVGDPVVEAAAIQIRPKRRRDGAA